MPILEEKQEQRNSNKERTTAIGNKRNTHLDEDRPA